ncbi:MULTISPECIES: VanW family protein [unclassified Serinicoccus]|uniref:VanW family protein n=1 Tax=unclassified Serinicoccus TaxID=2643101 RepID=UPI0038546BB5
MDDAVDRPTTLTEESDRRGWVPALLRLLIAAVVLGGAYVAVALYFQDRAPAGVSVSGVDIGSLSEDEAREKLDRELADRLSDPLTVQLRPGSDGDGDEALDLVPQEAGMSFDLDSTLRGTTGLSFDPRVLWEHVTGGEETDLTLVGAVDRSALEEELQRQAQDYDTAPVEGEVSLTDEGVQVVDAVDGRTLDVGATAARLDRAWVDQVWGERQEPGQERQVDGEAMLVPPALTTEEIAAFTEEELDPALSAPVLVEATRSSGETEQSATAELGRRDLLTLLQISQDGDELSLSIDEEATLARVRQDLGQLERGPRDASVRLDGSDVETVGARAGYSLETDGLVDEVSAALGATGEDRTVTAEVASIQPQIPDSVAEDWTFGEMASFTSAFPTGPANEARTENLRVGVRNVNGTVVMPGEQFRLGQALGDISEDAGYVEAPVIQDGRLVMGLGGGLSQISTVVFNTSWFAGVQLDAHTPHSFYIARYPAGREATLAIPSIDNVWTNDTDTPVVVRAGISGDEITMTFLGDRQYSVRTVDGERQDVTRGERRSDDSEDCVPQNPAEGFTIRTVRILSQGGDEVGRDEFTTTYQAADEIVCTNPETSGR